MEKQKIDTSHYKTNLELLQMIGGTPGKSISSWIHLSIPLLLIFIGTLHFGIYVIVEDDDIGMLELIEVVHWVVVYVCMFGINSSVAIRQNHYIEMHHMIKSGIYDYGEDFTEEQLKIREDTNKYIVKITFILKVAYLVATSSTFTKETIFANNRDEWTPLYRGWLPFKVDSLQTYLCTVAYHIVSATVIGGTASFVCIAYSTIGEHLCSQLKILKIALKNCLKENKLLKINDDEKHRRIKGCVEHHLQIIKLFHHFQSFIGMAAGVAVGSSVFMLCTLGFMLTDQDTSIKLFSFVLILGVEFLWVGYLSVYGQRISDLSKEVGNVVYFIDWYTQSASVQKDLLMMLIATREPLQLTGAGIYLCSLTGLKEMMQASYTYFNMLNATR